MVLGEIADDGHVLGSLFMTTNLDEIAWRLILEEGEDEDNGSEHDVQASRYLLDDH